MTDLDDTTSDLGTATPTNSGAAEAEMLAHALLQLIADKPGHVGRLRASRIVGGFAVAHVEGDDTDWSIYTAQPPSGWSIKEIVQLLDSLLAGGLLAQTTGLRPTLVLSRAGWRALESLDGATRPRAPGRSSAKCASCTPRGWRTPTTRASSEDPPQIGAIGLDWESSASRQHRIDTGRFLRIGEAV